MIALTEQVCESPNDVVGNKTIDEHRGTTQKTGAESAELFLRNSGALQTCFLQKKVQSLQETRVMKGL